MRRRGCNVCLAVVALDGRGRPIGAWRVVVCLGGVRTGLRGQFPLLLGFRLHRWGIILEGLRRFVDRLAGLLGLRGGLDGQFLLVLGFRLHLGRVILHGLRRRLHWFGLGFGCIGPGFGPRLLVIITHVTHHAGSCLEYQWCGFTDCIQDAV